MTVLAIRQSGGANIVSIPKAVLKTLGLHTGSALVLTIENNKIILSPAREEPTLEDILKGSPKQALTKSPEDQEWVNAKPVGKEI